MTTKTLWPNVSCRSVQRLKLLTTNSTKKNPLSVWLRWAEVGHTSMITHLPLLNDYINPFYYVHFHSFYCSPFAHIQVLLVSRLVQLPKPNWKTRNCDTKMLWTRSRVPSKWGWFLAAVCACYQCPVIWSWKNAFWRVVQWMRWVYYFFWSSL